MTARCILAFAATVVLTWPAHAGKGVRNRAGQLVTPSIDHRSLKAVEVVPAAELAQVGSQLAGRVVFDESAGLDRMPAEPIVYVDTTVPGAQPAERVVSQRDAVTVAKGERGLELREEGATPHLLEQVSVLPLAELPAPKTELAQAMLAASHPRLLGRSGDILHLVTNDLRPDDQIGEDGVLAWKLAWDVHTETVDLSRLLPDDPSGYRVFALHAVDVASGEFGAPVAWVLPWSGAAVDTSRSGVAITWLWESVPGQRKAKDWFPYVRRLEPSSGGRR